MQPLVYKPIAAACGVGSAIGVSIGVRKAIASRKRAIECDKDGFCTYDFSDSFFHLFSAFCGSLCGWFVMHAVDGVLPKAPKPKTPEAIDGGWIALAAVAVLASSAAAGYLQYTAVKKDTKWRYRFGEKADETPLYSDSDSSFLIGYAACAAVLAASATSTVAWYLFDE